MPTNPFHAQINLAAYAYLCSALWIALFFKFGRPFSLRNVDVIALQVPALGLLALLWEPIAGYVVLLAWCLGVLLRCLLDPALVRRPALGTNATPGALSFLASLAALATFVQLDRMLPTHVPRIELARESDEPGSRPAGGPAQFTGPVVLPVDRVLEMARESPTQLWLLRFVLTMLHLLIALGLAQIGVRWFADRTTAVAMACAYLLTPLPLWAGLNLHYVLPVLGLVWCIALFDWPFTAALLLGLLAVLCDGLVLLLPLWLPVLARYDRRAAWAGCATGLVVALVICYAGGITPALAPGRVLAVYVGRFELTPADSAWAQWPPAFRLPALAAHLCFVVLFMAWPLHKNLADLVAASAAVVAGMQWWYPIMGGTYVTWIVPLTIVLVFRPTLVRVAT